MAHKAKGTVTEAHRRFIDEYLIDLNGTRAYRVAYPGVSYAAARTNAGRLLALPAVAREVRAGRAAQRKRTRVTADRVLRELAAVAFSDIGELFDPSGRPIPLRELDPATRRAIFRRQYRQCERPVRHRQREVSRPVLGQAASAGIARPALGA